MYDFTDEKQAEEYLAGIKLEYTYQCYKEKSPEGCERLGEFLDMRKDYTTAAKVFKANCDEDNFGKSCFKYGSYRSVGKGGKKDEIEGLQYMEKACGLKFPQACHTLGIMHIQTGQLRDMKKALSFFEQGCEHGNQFSCFHASGLYLMGKDVPKNLKKAHDYSVKACNGGNVNACANLSQMYQRGDGVTENKDISMKYKEMAKRLREAKETL